MYSVRLRRRTSLELPQRKKETYFDQYTTTKRRNLSQNENLYDLIKRRQFDEIGFDLWQVTYVNNCNLYFHDIPVIEKLSSIYIKDNYRHVFFMLINGAKVKHTEKFSRAFIFNLCVSEMFNYPEKLRYSLAEEILRQGMYFHHYCKPLGTPLYTAVFWKQIKFIKLLLRNGCHVYAGNSKTHVSIMEEALGYKDILRLLLKYGGDLSDVEEFKLKTFMKNKENLEMINKFRIRSLKRRILEYYRRYGIKKSHYQQLPFDLRKKLYLMIDDLNSYKPIAGKGFDKRKRKHNEENTKSKKRKIGDSYFTVDRSVFDRNGTVVNRIIFNKKWNLL